LYFQRATFKRLIKGMVIKQEYQEHIDYDKYVRPRTSILRYGLDVQPEEQRENYTIHEEEIPKTGVLLTRKYKRTRSHDGSVHVWLSNQKSKGKGDINSNVQYD